MQLDRQRLLGVDGLPARLSGRALTLSVQHVAHCQRCENVGRFASQRLFQHPLRCRIIANRPQCNACGTQLAGSDRLSLNLAQLSAVSRFNLPTQRIDTRRVQRTHRLYQRSAQLARDRCPPQRLDQ